MLTRLWLFCNHHAVITQATRVRLVFGPTDLYVDTGRAEDEVSVPSMLSLTAHMLGIARAVLGRTPHQSMSSI